MGQNQTNQTIEFIDDFFGNDVYEVKKILGEGSFGKVFQAIDKDNNKIVALKRITPKSLDETLSICEEIKIMKKIKHKNVVKLLDYYQKSYIKQIHLYIVMECCEMNLDQFIEKKKIKKEEVVSYFLQLLEGLKCIHENNYIHRLILI
jgi:serine/threonine protein kinase